MTLSHLFGGDPEKPGKKIQLRKFVKDGREKWGSYLDLPVETDNNIPLRKLIYYDNAKNLLDNGAFDDFYNPVDVKTKLVITAPTPSFKMGGYALPKAADGFEYPQAGFKLKAEFDTSAADAALAGMGFMASMLESQNKSYQEWIRKHGLSDQSAPVVTGSRGDYTVNEGYFRPDQYTPVQFGAIPQAEEGGMFTDPLTIPLLDLPAAPIIPSDISLHSNSMNAVQPSNSTALSVDLRASGKDVATKTNNPGNMKWSEWMERFGGYDSGIKGKDGGTFAAFPNIKAGLQAYSTQLFGNVDGIFKSQHYKVDTPVNKALKTWSNNGYGEEIFPAIKGKTLGELTEAEREELIKRQIKRESGSMYKTLSNYGVFGNRANFNVRGEAGLNNASPWAINFGNQLQQMVGDDFEANSIYRTPKHNQEVGGKPNSKHLTGDALDIKPKFWRRLTQQQQKQLLKHYGAKAIDEGDHIHIQPYKEGGAYTVSPEELEQILAHGGEIEFL